MKKYIFTLSIFFISLALYAQEININLKSGSFTQEVVFDVDVNSNINYRYIVFNEVPNSERKTQIKELGIDLLEYLPQARNSNNVIFISSYSKNLNINNLELIDVKAILPILPEYKISPELHNGACPEHALEDNIAKLKVILYDNASLINCKKQLASFGVIDNIDNIDNIIYLNIPLTKLNELASIDFVSFIEPIDPPATFENKSSRSLIRSNVLNANYPSGRNYNGDGISVIMRDDGFINTGGISGLSEHPDKKGRVNESTGNCGWCDASSGNDHGDHVSGTIMGAGNVDPEAKGMADGVFLYVFDWDNNKFDSVPQFYNNNDAFITSSSLGDGCNNGYTSLSNKLDKQVRDYPSLMHVFSCGNSGTSNCSYGAGSGWGNITGGHKQGKNVIAVGNLNSTGVVANGSSRGPAADGRIKPDICAKGTSVWSTDDPSAANIYYSTSGTSMACPAVSGTLALLHEAYRDLNSGSNANSGLLKCLLLNTADDIGNPGPDFTHGYGEVNAFKAIKALEQGRYFSSSIGQGGSNIHNIYVPSGVKEIKVMVYWNDKEASSSASKALVNDIDMHLTTPGGTAYDPWVLDPTPNAINLASNAIRTFDDLNNMEQVTINSGGFIANQYVSFDIPSGLYSLAVSGYSVPFGPQEYWVVYDFLTDSIDITYPIGGEGFVPGETEIIRWDTYTTSGTFDLHYSIDNGANWILINSGIPADDRHFLWNVPNVTSGEVLVKVSRGSVSGTSESSFTIIDVPSQISVDWACPDSITVSWNGVNGADYYNVYMLADKYMEIVSTTNGNSVSFLNPDPTNIDSWFSVSAVKSNGVGVFVNSGEGRRAVAVNAQPINSSCALTADLHVSNSPYGLCFPLPCINTPPVSISGSVLSFNIDVQNQGTAVAPVSELGYYLSPNTTIAPCCQDILLATDQVDGGILPSLPSPITLGLFPGVTSNEVETIDLADPAFNTIANGTYYIGVYLDKNYVINETNEASNNAVALQYYNVINSITGSPVYNYYQITIQRGCMDSLATNYDPTANVPGVSCIYAPACVLAPYYENFDFGIGTFTNNGWTSNSGSTSSSATGPSDDMTGGGNYLYYETSTGFHPNPVLTSECLDISTLTSPALRFNYHMYGSSMGTLDVIVNGTIVWSMSGDQGNSWYQAQVDLSSFSGVDITIEFSGTYGGSYTGDMAIDNIEVDEMTILTINGCTDPLALNYNPLANVDDGSCNYHCCTSLQYGGGTADPYGVVTLSTCNYLSEYSTVSGIGAGESYTASISGPNANPGYIVVYEGSSCGNFVAEGLSPLTFTSLNAGTYYIHWLVDGNCSTNNGCHVTSLTGNQIMPIFGCTDSSACNYDLLANTDDGSCYFSINVISTTTNTSCNGSYDGSITVSASGGVLPYNYTIQSTFQSGSIPTSCLTTNHWHLNWQVSNPVLNNTFTYNTITCDNNTYGIFSGDYFVVAVDDNGCSDTILANVGSPNQISSTTSISNPTCLGNDGVISIFSSGGVPPYQYSFDGGITWQNSNIVNGLSAGNYNLATQDNNGCIDNLNVTLAGNIYGCIDPNATNYDPTANCDDGSCTYLLPSIVITNPAEGTVMNCLNNPTIGFVVNNFNVGAGSNFDGHIHYFLNGAMTMQYNNSHIQLSALTNGSYEFIIELVDNSHQSFNPIISDTVNFVINIINGCIDPNATNFDPNATCDDGSCIYPVYGCIDPCNICNYNPLATVDDGSCTYNTACMAYGCTDPNALNYDSVACYDDNSCVYLPLGCAEDAPTNLSATNIIQNRATINWDNMNSSVCLVDQYRIKFRPVGSSTWTQKTMGQPVGSCLFACNKVEKLILNLIPNTTYEYQMKAWYCGGGSSAWTSLHTFTTAPECPNVGNLAVTTPTPTKATFTWDDSNGTYSFTRIKSRVDIVGSTWFNVGGTGVAHGTFTKNKNGLTPGESYRGQARTWCDPNGGAYKSPSWTSLIYWTMPTVRMEVGTTISNLDVYPNPSRDMFNVTFTSEDVQDLEVRVINIIGEEIIKEDLQQFVGEYVKVIDFKQLRQGYIPFRDYYK